MIRLSRIALLVSATMLTAPGLQAQGLFSPVITVNDKAITGYELAQRALLIETLGAPGDARKAAREALIEDRLKQDAAQRLGFAPDDAAIQAGITEFAGRANMSPEQFNQVLANAGVSQETFRDFIRSGVLWRELVRARFASRVSITEAEVNAALSGLKGGTTAGAQVLLSEIILGIPQGREAEARDLANELSQITSSEDFAAAARRFSASPTREQGGRVPWMPLNNLPPQLRSAFLEMSPGEVTQPIPLSNAYAIFQLRALSEEAVKPVQYSKIKYMVYYMDGGRSPETLARAAQITADLDSCNDLYAVAKGQPPEVLEVHDVAPSEIPTDIGYELAKLDNNEVSAQLTRNNGQTLAMVMLCSRTAQQFAEVTQEQMRLNLQNERLSSYADGYLAQLRAEARIVEK